MFVLRARAEQPIPWDYAESHEELLVEARLPPHTRRQDVAVVVQRQWLRVSVGRQRVIDGPLAGRVCPARSSWHAGARARAFWRLLWLLRRRRPGAAACIAGCGRCGAAGRCTLPPTHRNLSNVCMHAGGQGRGRKLSVTLVKAPAGAAAAGGDSTCSCSNSSRGGVDGSSHGSSSERACLAPGAARQQPRFELWGSLLQQQAACGGDSGAERSKQGVLQQQQQQQQQHQQ
jgi:hypothetical protein